MIIPARPLLESFLLSPNLTKKEFYSSINFTKNGRTALEELALEFKLKKGDKILIPGLICYSAIENLIKIGLKPIFYDLELNLNLNWSYISKHLKHKDIKAILIVNYFGFIDTNKYQILSLCRDQDLLVIDDYCHSFLTFYLKKNRNNMEGIKVFFNFNKLVRIGGGGYIINSKVEKKYLIKSETFINHILRFILSNFEKFNIKFSILNIYNKRIFWLKKYFLKIFKSKMDHKKDFNYYLINSSIAELFSNEKLLREVQRKRLNNYKIIYKSLLEIGITPIQKIKDEEITPQNISIIDNSGYLNNYLRERGIGSYTWPGEELPIFNDEEEENLKNTFYIHKRIVCLPVHQSIKNNDIKYIIEKVKEYYSRNNIL